jgi:type I restriction enzyme S subunit
MVAKSRLSPRDELLKDSETWPDEGLPFGQIADRVTLPHDDMRDALFELLSGPKPTLRQRFDRHTRTMMIQRAIA